MNVNEISYYFLFTFIVYTLFVTYIPSDVLRDDKWRLVYEFYHLQCTQLELRYDLFYLYRLRFITPLI